MGQENRPDAVILLVGSNPLPNYLAAMALKPSIIHLVYSDSTSEPMKRLRAALCKDLPGTIIGNGVCVNDPFSASDVTGAVCNLISNGTSKNHSVHLHYTGGTKVMSAHALNAFYKKGAQPESASYLDESKACLRFDNGRQRSLSDCSVSLTLDRILQLHGVKQKPRSPVGGGPTADDISAICQKLLTEPSLAKTFYEKSNDLKKHKKKPDKAIPDAFDPSEYGLSFSVSKVPDQNGWKEDRFKAWWRSLGGEWLEDWVAGTIQALNFPGITDSDISAGVNCTRDETNRSFEVDVAVIRGQRSYFISCTTDTSLGLCKSKAFEIAARSRQMGGDLARSALVCLLHGEDTNGSFVDQLRADVADVWGSSNPTRIFGLEDLRQWAGHYGSPNHDSLKKWLES